MTQRVVINACYGGFGLSSAAFEAYQARKGHPRLYWFTPRRRHDGSVDVMEKVPTTDPGSEFIAFAYTTPDPSDESYVSKSEIDRDDPDLVAVVEEMGEAANGSYAELRVVELPDDVEWDIDEYDGHEHVAERHRTWR